MKLIFYHSGDEETLHIVLESGDGRDTDVIRTDYDLVGWSGLAAVRETAETLARAAGWSVEHSYGDEDDYEDEEAPCA